MRPEPGSGLSAARKSLRSAARRGSLGIKVLQQIFCDCDAACPGRLGPGVQTPVAAKIKSA